MVSPAETPDKAHRATFDRPNPQDSDVSHLRTMGIPVQAGLAKTRDSGAQSRLGLSTKPSPGATARRPRRRPGTRRTRRSRTLEFSEAEQLILASAAKTADRVEELRRLWQAELSADNPRPTMVVKLTAEIRLCERAIRVGRTGLGRNDRQGRRPGMDQPGAGSAASQMITAPDNTVRSQWIWQLPRQVALLSDSVNL